MHENLFPPAHTHANTFFFVLLIISSPKNSERRFYCFYRKKSKRVVVWKIIQNGNTVVHIHFLKADPYTPFFSVLFQILKLAFLFRLCCTIVIISGTKITLFCFRFNLSMGTNLCIMICSQLASQPTSVLCTQIFRIEIRSSISTM